MIGFSGRKESLLMIVFSGGEGNDPALSVS
jgi:hypothetical protein